MNYMSERIDERPLLSELANFVELSPDHFSRCFTATTGLTPHQWQTNLRIEEAKRQLRDTNASMTEIAHSLGFSSSAHRSDEHTSELQSLMLISYAAFFLKTKNKTT